MIAKTLDDIEGIVIAETKTCIEQSVFLVNKDTYASEYTLTPLAYSSKDMRKVPEDEFLNEYEVHVFDNMREFADWINSCNWSE